MSDFDPFEYEDSEEYSYYLQVSLIAACIILGVPAAVMAISYIAAKGVGY